MGQIFLDALLYFAMVHRSRQYVNAIHEFSVKLDLHAEYIYTCIRERKSRILVVEYPKLVDFLLKNVQNWDQSWQAVGITFKEAMRVAHKLFFLQLSSLFVWWYTSSSVLNSILRTFTKQGSSARKFIGLRGPSRKTRELTHIWHQRFLRANMAFCSESINSNKIWFISMYDICLDLPSQLNLKIQSKPKLPIGKEALCVFGRFDILVLPGGLSFREWPSCPKLARTQNSESL